MKKLRVAFLGVDHAHIHNLAHNFVKYDDMIELVGIAPVPPFSTEELELNKRLNIPADVNFKIWDDYKELLAQNIDIAVITTNVARHADIAEETLGAGINTLVEKPMAVSMDDAERMYQAYKKSTAELIINWPIAWFPAFRKAKELADSGIVGDVLRVHYRSPATIGPYQKSGLTSEERSKLWWYRSEDGGGSICDYTCYGCVLTTWIANAVGKRVSGFKNTRIFPFSEAEDYSTFTIDFGNVIGIVEGSWATLNNAEIPTGPIVYGTNGVIVADRYSSQVKVYNSILSEEHSSSPVEVFNVEPIDEDIAISVIKHLTEGAPLNELVTVDFNMKAMASLDAGIRSCNSGMIENVKELNFF